MHSSKTQKGRQQENYLIGGLSRAAPPRITSIGWNVVHNRKKYQM